MRIDGRTLHLDDLVRTPYGLGYIIEFDPGNPSGLEVYVQCGNATVWGSKFWFTFAECQTEEPIVSNDAEDRHNLRGGKA
jgi:hypothetical protein